MSNLIKTKYPGVKYREKAATGERVYFIRYRTRKPGGGWQQHHEVAGYQHRDNMTAAKASNIRGRRMHGKQKPNRERRAEREAEQGKKTWTVSNLWLEYRAANPDLKGYHVYNAIYSAHVAPIFAGKEPKDITPFDIDRLKHRQMRGKSDKSIANALELLRRIVNFGTRRGLCAGPGFTIRLPQVHNQKTEDLTPKQLSSLLETIDRHITYRTPCRWGAYMMRLALLTAMRRGEMFKLAWDDIDRHRGTITLRDAKSGRDETIPLSTYAARLLDTIHETEKTEGPLVFPGAGGDVRASIAKSVNKIKKEAGLPADFRPLHGLRHVFASMLVSHGVSLDIVSRLLTHKGQTVTHRYAHVRDDALREAAELAGRLVEEAATSNVVVLQDNVSGSQD